jgi:hypothetical protein
MLRLALRCLVLLFALLHAAALPNRRPGLDLELFQRSLPGRRLRGGRF